MHLSHRFILILLLRVWIMCLLLFNSLQHYQNNITQPLQNLQRSVVLGLSYPRALAGLILAVDLLLSSLVQFGPKGFDFPGADCRLQ